MDAPHRPGRERLSRGRTRRRQAIVARADSGARGPRPGPCVAMALPTGAAGRLRRPRGGGACALRRPRGARRRRAAGPGGGPGRGGRGGARRRGGAGSPLGAGGRGWGARLRVPPVPADWWGGWPWGPGQIVALFGAFCLAGVRYRRPVLWWMWALSLIPWCLWLAADVANLNGPASAIIIFTVATIAGDNVGPRLPAQRSLAVPTRRPAAQRGRLGAPG